MSAKATALILAALFTILLCPANAAADTLLFTNLGPNGEYDTNNAYFVSGTVFSNQVIAEPFTPGMSVHISYAELALGHHDGINNPLNVYLMSDTAGQPGSVLDTLTQVGTIPEYSGGGGLVRYNCTACVGLTAGTTYWIAALEPEADSEQGWMLAYQDVSGNIVFNQEGTINPSQWTAYNGSVSGFRVYGGGFGDGAPEPGTLVMLGTGVLAVAGAFRRKLGL